MVHEDNTWPRKIMYYNIIGNDKTEAYLDWITEDDYSDFVTYERETVTA